jgi:hypothetical protein
MKRLFLICCVAVIALLSLSCTPESTLEVSVSEIDNGIVVENVGNVDCIVFVGSPDSGQQFELAVGERVTVMDISQPIEVSAVSLREYEGSK